MHIHLLGPSGSGTSTLGKALSEALHFPWFDADDIFWERTDPPFTKKRTLCQRIELLNTIDTRNASWILSGSILKWGDFLRDRMDLIIYLYIDTETRIQRLIQREKERFGRRIEKGNDMYENHQAFLTWAASYEEGDLEMRSRRSESLWIEKAHCKIIKIEKVLPVSEEVDIVLRNMKEFA